MKVEVTKGIGYNPNIELKITLIDDEVAKLATIMEVTSKIKRHKNKLTEDYADFAQEVLSKILKSQG